MKLGTKSLLFGCHQFILHPIFVLLGWVRLYGWRSLTPGILLIIIIHDWGYWGCKEMDGEDGEQHPIVIAKWLLSRGWNNLKYEVLLHSRHLALDLNRRPSHLCWADKMAITLYPSWLWAFLAHLSGEGYEYMDNPHSQDYVPGEAKTIHGLYIYHTKVSIKMKSMAYHKAKRLLTNPPLWPGV